MSDIIMIYMTILSHNFSVLKALCTAAKRKHLNGRCQHILIFLNFSNREGEGVQRPTIFLNTLYSKTCTAINLKYLTPFDEIQNILRAQVKKKSVVKKYPCFEIVRLPANFCGSSQSKSHDGQMFTYGPHFYYFNRFLNNGYHHWTTDCFTNATRTNEYPILDRVNLLGLKM